MGNSVASAVPEWSALSDDWHTRFAAKLYDAMSRNGFAMTGYSVTKIVAYADAVSKGEKLIDFTPSEIDNLSGAFAQSSDVVVLKPKRPRIPSFSTSAPAQAPSTSKGEPPESAEPKAGPEGSAAESASADDEARVNLLDWDEGTRVETAEIKRELAAIKARSAALAMHAEARALNEQARSIRANEDALPRNHYTKNRRPMTQGGSVAYPNGPASPVPVPPSRGNHLSALLVSAMLLATLPLSLKVLADRVQFAWLADAVRYFSLDVVLLLIGVSVVLVAVAAWDVLPVTAPGTQGVAAD